MQPNGALDAAIALSRTPNLAALMRARELPGDVVLLLRVLADDAEAVQQARRMAGLSSAAIVMISERYVKEVLLFGGAPPRRVLGLTAKAGRSEARTNMKFLLSWLHPDKNSSKWQSAFATRVIEAWHLIGDGQAQQDFGDTPSRLEVIHRRHRLPWIPMPVESVSLRQRLRISRRLLTGIAVAFLIFGLLAPEGAVFAICKDIMTAFFDIDTASTGIPSDISAITDNGPEK